MVQRLKLMSEDTVDAIIIGLVSQEPDYKVSLSINRKLGYGLKSVEPITLETEKPDNDIFFSKFSYAQENRDLTINLISNRVGNNFFIKKLVNIDFLFVIYNADNNRIIDEIVGKLREINGITAVFIIDQNQTKDKNLQLLQI